MSSQGSEPQTTSPPQLQRASTRSLLRPRETQPSPRRARAHLGMAHSHKIHRPRSQQERKDSGRQCREHTPVTLPARVLVGPCRVKKAVTKPKVASAAVAGGAAGSSAPQAAALRASGAPGAPRGALGPHTDLLRTMPPNTPLATVLHQFKEAEVAWAHEKVQGTRSTAHVA